MVKAALFSHYIMRTMVKRVFFSTSATKLEGGVSMVQGASRGIGLEFVRQLLHRKETGHVVATCRDPDSATDLQKLKKDFDSRLNILPLDVTNESTIEEAATTIRDTYGYLNLLINASGILSIPNLLQPETTLSKVEKSSLLLTYEVNAIGPILVVKHMWPFLKVGGGTGTEREVAVVANLSARVGSIRDNGLGGWHSYRASKTALNQCMFILFLSIFMYFLSCYLHICISRSQLKTVLIFALIQFCIVY
ncbi:NAD(P)-binding Rossmann-fold superfamily protein [Rhynchospora pubera]|uniref:NAD(P)-binding Rossmann-fold superfamily protein n=1 Tax=Rhynchospora pubera TaxID=906938 RepID=A0AAV8ELA7_9POAL|nr:NAD(P)-binding Rossmann-fold superfamily protein [Rhynchospora pubera]